MPTVRDSDIIRRVNRTKRHLILATVFICCAAALIQLIVWMERLMVIFGATAGAIGTIVAVILGGFAIGIWVWGRIADQYRQSCVLIFAVLEIALGLDGFASLWILRGIQFLHLATYSSVSSHSILFAGLQFLLIALLLASPLILTSGFLPLLSASIIVNSNEIAACSGFIYGWGMLGACGAAAAMTYGLLAAFGFSESLMLASFVSVFIGAVAFVGRPQKHHTSLATGRPNPRDFVNVPAGSVKRVALVGFGISACSFAAFAMGWLRLLTMALGSSIYVYGTFFVVVLGGLGCGSLLYSRAERNAERHQARFVALVCGQSLAAALSIIIVARIPILFVRFLPLFSNSFGRQIAAYFIATAAVSLPICMLFGATFPAIVGSIGGDADRAGRAIGVTYAVNTIGVLIGIFLFGFIVMPMAGLRASMSIGVLATALTGAVLWWRISNPRRIRFNALPLAVSALLILVPLSLWREIWRPAVFTAGMGFEEPHSEVQGSPQDIASRTRLIYSRDGIVSTTSVDELNRTLYYRSSGEIKGSTEQADMSRQLLMGHLPMLLHPSPRDVLVLGLDTGVTAAAVTRYPAKEIDIAEEDPSAARASRFFDAYSRKVLDDRRVRLIEADGRALLLESPKQYDVIVSSACELWQAGCELYYTADYYRIVASRLRAGGVFVESVNTHTLLPGDMEFLAATFRAEFPHMQVWSSSPGNFMFLGTRDAIAWDYTRLKQKFDHVIGVAEDLKAAGIWTPFALFGAQVLGESGSAALTHDVDGIDIDDRPTIEFRAARALYADTAPLIANDLDRFVLTGAPPINGFDPQRDLDAQGAYLLGFAYASVGRSELAIPYMERSTHLEPKNALFFVGLANEYRQVDKPEDAARAYERALELDLNNVEALVSLGEIRFEEGQLDWTRVLASRALRLAPENVRVHALIGKLQEASR